MNGIWREGKTAILVWKLLIGWELLTEVRKGRVRGRLVHVLFSLFETEKARFDSLVEGFRDSFSAHAPGAMQVRIALHIDLLVLFSEVADPHQRAAELYASLVDFPRPMDIVVSTSGRFERYRNVVNTVYWPASREGKVLHERAA